MMAKNITMMDFAISVSHLCYYLFSFSLSLLFFYIYSVNSNVYNIIYIIYTFKS